MANQQQSIENLFGKLDTQIRNGHTKRALKTADEILKVVPGDGDVIAVKAALLIDLGSNADALALIDSSPQAATSLAFERAYCIYRLGRFEDALAAVKVVGPERAADALQLEAQVQYRLGNYHKAIELYDSLFKEHGEENLELKANVVAAYAASGRGDEIPAAMAAARVSPEDSFEIGFNAACGEVLAGRLTQAEEQLQLARRVGEELLYEEDLEEDEVEAELAPVTAQLAYVAALQGHLEDARKRFADALALEGGDLAVGAVAACNLAAVLLRQRPGDRKAAAEGVKVLEPYLERSGGYLHVKPGVQGRLGAAHVEGLLSTYASAALHANRLDVAKEAVRSLERSNGKGSPAASLLHAALLLRDGKTKEAASVLDTVATSTKNNAPSLALDAQLMRAQLAAARGDVATAVAAMDALPREALLRPAVVATKAALLESKGEVEEATTVLRTALQKDGEDRQQDVDASRWVLRRLAKLETERGNIEAATFHLKRIVSADPTSLEDPEVLEVLPRLLACIAPSEASGLLDLLPEAVALSATEIDGLESAGGAGMGGSNVGATVGVAGGKRKDAPGDVEDGTGDGARKHRRKRKPRYPKNFDPGNPGPLPDPERWLPKWQRSTIKKKRKGKDRDVVKGAQGAGRVDAALDRTGTAEPPPTSKAPMKAPSGKKKGKGRR